MSGTEEVAPLSVATEDLTLSLDGVTMPVQSTGERLFVDVATVRDAVRLARAVRADAEEPGRILTATDLTTELRVRGRTVVVLGTGARPGAMSRQLGIAPAELRVGGLATAAGNGALATLRRVWRWLD